ncbi:MAG: pepN1 [Marmoricola sp.]|nr:pepN1 [Marmoricola sp.]
MGEEQQQSQDRSLTQAEAEQRAALLAVSRYEIDIDMTGLLDGPELRCISTITFTSRDPGTDTFVDCAADVVSALLNGVELPPAEQGRITLTGLAEENVLVVESIQASTTDGEGVHRAVDPTDQQVYVWTSFEPDEARHVWACFDQPDLKAPHTFTVTAPEAWTVVSNSGDPVVEAVIETADASDGVPAQRWTFPETPPLSTYNPVVLAGPFHEIRREVDGRDLGLFARQSISSILERDADELFTVTGQGLAFFGEVFAMPFPQDKYDQVFLPEFGGAMENYGCVAWSDAFLSRVEPTPAESDLLARVLLHEMAHMWFGNIVTMRWWDDLWLNEAFAEFACNWAMVRATSYADAWAGHLASGKLTAYLADQGPASHPIRQPIHDVAQAAASFDAITYPKGASTLAQLMHYLGEDVFITGMAAYFARYAWGNTTLQDLVDELAAASGRDLDAWRTAWLETAGVDLFRLEGEDGGFTLVATPPDESAPRRPHALAVGAYRRTPDGLERLALADVEVTGTRTSVDLPSGADLYLVNDDDLTFARTRPDAASRDSLFQLAPALPSAISRGVAIATAWDMLTTGEARTAEVVGALTGVLRAETAAACVEPYLALALGAVDLWSPDAERDELAAQVADACRELAETPDRRQVALRGLARTAGLDEVSELLAQTEDDIDLRWRLLTRQAALGGDVDQDGVRRLVERDHDPEAWVRALVVRAATPTAADKEAVWQAIAVDRSVPISSIGQVATAFWVPSQVELQRPYAERYLELLPELHGGGMIQGMVKAGRLFPPYGIDEAYVERAIEAAVTSAPVVKKRVTERADEVRRMLVARGL